MKTNAARQSANWSMPWLRLHRQRAKLGLDNLGQCPNMVVIGRHYNKRHGTIHPDSKSKIATAGPPRLL